jgi:hypothetical protein
MTRRVVRAAAVGLLAVLAACGVPTQRSAQKADADEVPYGLLEQRDRETAAGRSGEEDVVLSFERNDRLVAVPRRLPGPASLSMLLAALRRGPTSEEVSVGVRSAIPRRGALRSVSLAGGTATVDLAPGFATLSSADQLVALAQIVYTLTARPGVGQIRFTLDGESTEVPRANGSLTAGRVSRDDYAVLAPPG